MTPSKKQKYLNNFSTLLPHNIGPDDTKLVFNDVTTFDYIVENLSLVKKRDPVTQFDTEVEYIILTLDGFDSKSLYDSGAGYSNLEIVKLTKLDINNTSPTLSVTATIERGLEGTQKKTFLVDDNGIPINSVIEARLTAGTLQNISQLGDQYNYVYDFYDNTVNNSKTIFDIDHGLNKKVIDVKTTKYKFYIPTLDRPNDPLAIDVENGKVSFDRSLYYVATEVPFGFDMSKIVRVEYQADSQIESIEYATNNTVRIILKTPFNGKFYIK